MWCNIKVDSNASKVVNLSSTLASNIFFTRNFNSGDKSGQGDFS